MGTFAAEETFFRRNFDVHIIEIRIFFLPRFRSLWRFRNNGRCRIFTRSGRSVFRFFRKHHALEGRFYFLDFPFFIGFCHGKTGSGAVIYADSAGDAFFTVNGPSLVFCIHRDGGYGTIVRTGAAEEAIGNIDPHMTVIENQGRFFGLIGRDGSRRFRHGRFPVNRFRRMHEDVRPVSKVAAQGQTFSRTVVDTGPAIDAGFQIDSPGPVRPVHGNGPGRTVSLTLAAENTFQDIIDDMTPVIHGCLGHIDGSHSPFPFGRRTCFLDLENDFRFLHVRIRGMGIHMETFLRAVFHAARTLDTGEGIDFPGPVFAVHRNGPRGAGLFAHAAENAFGRIIDDTAPVIRLEFFRFDGVTRGHRRFEQVGKGLFHVNQKTHGAPPYRSQQLIQGSMVRIRFPTSARSQPSSIFTRAGILTFVGVRRRNLSRFFVPFPFT